MIRLFPPSCLLLSCLRSFVVYDYLSTLKSPSFVLFGSALDPLLLEMFISYLPGTILRDLLPAAYSYRVGAIDKTKYSVPVRILPKVILPCLAFSTTAVLSPAFANARLATDTMSL